MFKSIQKPLNENGEGRKFILQSDTVKEFSNIVLINLNKTKHLNFLWEKIEVFLLTLELFSVPGTLSRGVA